MGDVLVGRVLPLVESEPVDVADGERDEVEEPPLEHRIEGLFRRGIVQIEFRPFGGILERCRFQHRLIVASRSVEPQNAPPDNEVMIFGLTVEDEGRFVEQNPPDCLRSVRPLLFRLPVEDLRGGVFGDAEFRVQPLRVGDDIQQKPVPPEKRLVEIQAVFQARNAVVVLVPVPPDRADLFGGLLVVIDAEFHRRRVLLHDPDDVVHNGFEQVLVTCGRFPQFVMGRARFPGPLILLPLAPEHGQIDPRVFSPLDGVGTLIAVPDKFPVPFQTVILKMPHWIQPSLACVNFSDFFCLSAEPDVPSGNFRLVS